MAAMRNPKLDPHDPRLFSINSLPSQISFFCRAAPLFTGPTSFLRQESAVLHFLTHSIYTKKMPFASGNQKIGVTFINYSTVLNGYPI
jgi:hypothetical protein